MPFYCAPMEGVTGRLYRAAHHRFFPGVDKYYMPFISTTQNHCLTRRERQALTPEPDLPLPAVPQLLGKNADDFIWTARVLHQMGHSEVNLNLGCPSRTVVAKGKGAGFLADPEGLDAFLDQVFSAVEGGVSIKTRLGKSSPDEFSALMEIYNKYPIRELTIHPRIQTDFYQNDVNLDVFAAALAVSKAPVCYNGDLMTTAHCAAITARFPAVGALMSGRGLLADPALAAKHRGGAAADKATLQAFTETVYEGYCDAFGSRRNAMLRMKEFWFYLICLFADHEKYAKKLKKATDFHEYESLSAGIFHQLDLLDEPIPAWRASL